MNNKIIILLILIVFIFIIIDCNCKEGFSIGGPNYVLVEVDTNRIIEDDEGFGGQNLVNASNIVDAINIFETYGIDFDDNEYQVKLQSDAVDVDASDTVPEPSPDFDFEDEEEEELEDLYESGSLLGRCILSENDIIQGECKFIKDLDNYETIMMTIVKHVKPFSLEDDDPGFQIDRLHDIVQEYIDNTIIQITQVNDRIDIVEANLSTLDKDSDDYNLLNKIKKEYTTKRNIVNDHKSLLESYIEEI